MAKKLTGRLLQSTVLAGMAAIAAPAFAQDTIGEGATTQPEATDSIIVTGSRIQRDGNLVEASPVTTLGAEQFDIQGTLRAEDLINALPQAFGAQGSNLANGSSGTASVNLRGLGSERTLVLVNGRRLPYGSVNIYAPDINFVPTALVEQVDVLTGGASAVYGADAVAGVVNFRMADDFEGFRLEAIGSVFQHDNDGELQGLLEENAAANPNQFRVPSGSTTDGASRGLTGVLGGDFAEGRGHFTAFASFQQTDPVFQGDRDYAQCALGISGGEFTCSGSGTNEIANILDVAGGYAIPGAVTANVSGEDFAGPAIWARVNPDASGTIIPRDFTTDTFNFNPFNHYQRPSERYNAGFFAQYDLADQAELYTEFMFMDNRTNSQIAPSGVFGLGVSGSDGGINCGNPFLSAQQRDYLCGEIADDTLNRRTNADGEFIDLDGNVLAEDDDTFYPDADNLPDQLALGDDDIAPVLLLRRNVEGGARNQDIRHTTFRGVVGVRGDFGNSGLAYDAYALYANTHRIDVYRNDLSQRNIARALNAVEDDDGNIVCAVNADADPANNDPNCVPYDIFTGNAPDPAAVDYLVQPLNRDGNTEQWVVSGTISGSLEEFDFRSPLAEDAIAFALGAEYRRDRISSDPDANFISGDGAGQGGPTLPINGAVEAVDVFVEVNVPLIQGQPWAEQFGIDAAYRRSNYTNSAPDTLNTSFAADAYKFGADYAPTDDLRFRASYQRAVRAPNIFDLFSAQSIGLFDLTADEATGLFDPCAGGSPVATFEQCARTGVTRDQYGSIADNPAGQFNNLTGGNANLDPETSDTFTVGAVFTPAFLDGLTLSVDYFDIEVEDYINTVPESLALNSCLNTGNEFFCGLVNRGAGGTLWANQTGFITATNVNTGAIATKGIDLLANYTFELNEYGFLSFDYVGTFLDSLEVTPLPTSGPDDIFDCAGLYGGRCQNNFGSGANPEYRHRAQATWGFGPGSVTATWRYFDEVTLDGSDGTGSNGTLEKEQYLDLAGQYELSERITVRAGVNNVFDNDPPLSSVVGTAPGNGNTYPQVYDALGRYIFAGATLDF